MSGKRRVCCYHQGCSTHSFEDKGILNWECYKHSPNDFNRHVKVKEYEVNTQLTTEDKLNLLLEYLGLEIESEPKVIKKTPKLKKNN